MNRWFTTLYARMSLVLIVLFASIGIAYLALVYWSSNRYYQEMTQNLNRSLGMYIVNRAPLISDGVVNHTAMQELAALVMVVNPIVEVYLTDTSGNILDHAFSESDLALRQIDVEPIKAWLSDQRPLPIVGTDPRTGRADKVFSAWPVEDAGQQVGYLYVVLGGKLYQSLRDSLTESYVLRLSLGGLVAIVFFALLTAVLIFAAMTRPLRRLARDMQNFQETDLNVAQAGVSTGDEIAYLQDTFHRMREKIHDQLQRLEQTDRLRRELVSNVSHDLRTPLASMQGYLETLSISGDKLNDTERSRYLTIAYTHCRRLTKLVQELFELSKLDTGRTELSCETFFLAELLQDVLQKFELKASQRNISVNTDLAQRAYAVTADIGLMERVFENLIDNALCYTPDGGSITVSLAAGDNGVAVDVADTGVGVAKEKLPRIFERYYQAKGPRFAQGEGTGLGLAIVKRILDLHHCQISVTSEEGAGTCFSFELPQAKVG
ncbi:sensor histidine kinase [Gilvimarinus polysaccharolyticus]|uniref:sensor histidine kinase n=1 Tax=Gilvimarinus polysaccharolyticus TaxID=863921 RepID=UPI0006730D35|nr:HAMP domain-containing sensor histidine kinase [Gilvimarinus polysaccharolyticus]